MAAKKEWKWGYVDKEGRMAIAAAYDDAWEFHEGVAAVKVDWARGYIDRDGRWVIEPRFEKAGPFVGGVAEVVEDGEVRHIDREGRYVEAPSSVEAEMPSASAPDASLREKYFDVGVCSEGLVAVRKSASGKWGYADPEGRMVIRPQFRQASPFSEGLAAVLVAVDFP